MEDNTYPLCISMTCMTKIKTEYLFFAVQKTVHSSINYLQTTNTSDINQKYVQASGLNVKNQSFNQVAFVIYCKLEISTKWHISPCIFKSGRLVLKILL